MSRTIRKAYTGAHVRDGQWTRRCPEPHCDWCVRGRAKRAWNRKQRHEAKEWARFDSDEGPSAPVSTPGFVSQWIEDPAERRKRAEEYVSRLNVHYWVDYDGKVRKGVPYSEPDSWYT